MAYKTSLKKVGGSVMLAIPPALLELLHLQAGVTVGIAIDGGRLVVEPHKKSPRYTLAELLAQCGDAAELSAENRAWLDADAVGGEIL